MTGRLDSQEKDSVNRQKETDLNKDTNKDSPAGPENPGRRAVF